MRADVERPLSLCVIVRMRRGKYRSNSKSQQDGVRSGGRGSTTRADVHPSQDTRPMLGDLPSSANPRIRFENFDQGRFITDPVEPYVRQAMDIIEAFDIAW